MISKRKIKIVLDQRSSNDSSILLENISNAFPSDDITIKFNYERIQEENYEIINDVLLEQEVTNHIKRALDKVNTDENQVSKKNIDHTHNNKFNAYLKKLGLEGIKVTVTTLLKSALALLLK